jgi:hypothetical protein
MIAPAIVFLMSFLASAACAVLLARAFRQSGTRMLFWSALSFGFLALNNALAVIDIVFLTDTSISEWRVSAALVAVTILIYGFIWQSE